MRAAITQSLVGLSKDSLTVVFLVALMFWQDWRMALIAPSERTSRAGRPSRQT
jgi:ABC-type bacteriocin/lantibiotic exporter with double-glycine peptidase domain